MRDTQKSGRRTHDPAFKERAVAMAAESGNIAQTARQLGIGYSMLNNVKQTTRRAMALWTSRSVCD